MSQVSRHYLDSRVQSQMYETFLDVIAEIKEATTVKYFLRDLLSPTELTMLSKRLSIAYMLRKGYTERVVCHTLKVSLGTVNKISGILQRPESGYTHIIDKMLAQAQISQFFDTIMEKIDHALPPKGASWSQHYRASARQKRAKAKAF